MKNIKKIRILLSNLIISSLILLTTSCSLMPEISDEYISNLDPEQLQEIIDIYGNLSESGESGELGETDSPGELGELGELGLCKMVVIDCGQGDSILLQNDQGNVLIDASESKDATEIMEVLDSYNVETIDILVATHPHADHIAGMETILNNYNTDTIIMSPTSHTSKMYKSLLTNISNQGKEINTAKVGDVYSVGDLKLDIIGPVEKTGDLNNDSVVMIASYGDTDILLTGDAEEPAELTFLENVRDVEILKAGHHGSSTSSSNALLDVAKPEIAVISCGKDNKYGHPHEETIERFNNYNIQYFRTDIDGDIVLVTDGKTVSVETDLVRNPEVPINQIVDMAFESMPENTIVYVTRNSSTYHLDKNCIYLNNIDEVGERYLKDVIDRYGGCLNCIG